MIKTGWGSHWVLAALALGNLCSCARPGMDSGQEGVIQSPPDQHAWTVHAVVEAPDSIVGMTLRVQGNCAGWGGPAKGPPPLTRSDWQLTNDTVGLWVSGPLPQGCDPVDPPPELQFEVVAVVAVDTVSILGEVSPLVRRFLRPVGG